MGDAHAGQNDIRQRRRSEEDGCNAFRRDENAVTCAAESIQQLPRDRRARHEYPSGTVHRRRHQLAQARTPGEDVLTQERQIVHGHDPGSFRRWQDEIGRVHDVDRAGVPLYARPCPAPPRPLRHSGRHSHAMHVGRRLAPERDRVPLNVDACKLQLVAELAHVAAHPRGRIQQRTCVERDAHEIGGYRVAASASSR
jgi:hypothetical protein